MSQTHAAVPGNAVLYSATKLLTERGSHHQRRCTLPTNTCVYASSQQGTQKPKPLTGKVKGSKGTAVLQGGSDDRNALIPKAVHWKAIRT